MAIKASPSAQPIYSRWAAITPNDTTQYGSFATTPTEDICALLVTVTGNLAIIDADGNTVTFTSLAANVILPLSPKIIKATGTTATVVALFW